MADFYQNHQWKVTEEGLGSIGQPAANFIEASRLGQMRDVSGRKIYEWPLHMADKTWVDIEAFIDAFKEALNVHSSQLSALVDQNLLVESVEEARKLAGRRTKPKDSAGTTLD